MNTVATGNSTASCFDATLILTGFSSLACDVRRVKQSIFGPLLSAKGVGSCCGKNEGKVISGIDFQE